MAINFKKFAKSQTVLSDIMESRTKVDKTDGVVTIVDFDIVSGKNGEAYAICAINDHQFINGGFVLTKIFTGIVTEYDGNIDLAREDYRNSGGLKVKLSRERTRTGNNITRVEVL